MTSVPSDDDAIVTTSLTRAQILRTFVRPSRIYFARDMTKSVTV